MKTRMQIRDLIFTLLMGCFLSLSPSVFAQDDEEGAMKVTGNFEMGGQAVTRNSDSSKFNEYRDITDDLFVPKFELNGETEESGYYLRMRGRNVTRKDQEFGLELGQYGDWNFLFDYSQVPHLLSNNAKTPYRYSGSGVYNVDGGVSGDIGFTHIEQGNNQTWLRDQDDRLVSALYTPGVLDSIALGTQRNTGGGRIDFYPFEGSHVSMDFHLTDKDGSTLSGASLGDRPPRSMVVQLPSPVDHTTFDFSVKAAQTWENVQADISYTGSRFENDIQSMRWESLFYNADAGRDYVTLIDTRGTSPTTRLYSEYGEMALDPDNEYHNIDLNLGFDLFMNSRLTVSGGYSRMEQDESLLPYATSDFNMANNADGVATDWNDVSSLPRTSADAQINVYKANAAYNIDLTENLEFHTRYRYYHLDNETRRDNWAYTGGDSRFANTKNKRTNLQYGYEQNNVAAGLDYDLGQAGKLGFEYEYDNMERPYREVKNTKEHAYNVSYRLSSWNWMDLSARYRHADRGGSDYNGEITDLSYWYTNDYLSGDDPLNAFGNAPGLRKFDVAARDQDLWDASIGLRPSERLNVGFGYRRTDNDYRANDIPAEVSAYIRSASLLAALNTAGVTTVDNTQLGNLEDWGNSYTVDVNYLPMDRLKLYAYYSRDEYTSKQRGRYLDENERTTANRDWNNTTGDYLWFSKNKDINNTVGARVDLSLIPDALDFSTDYTYSEGTVKIDYSAGANIAEDDATSKKNWGEWESPGNVYSRTQTYRAGFAYHFTRHLTLGLQYLLDDYAITDWQQEGTGAHQESNGENFVRDSDPETIQGSTSRQDREGNRLVRLTDYLADDYTVHVGLMTLTYRW